MIGEYEGEEMYVPFNPEMAQRAREASERYNSLWVRSGGFFGDQDPGGIISPVPNKPKTPHRTIRVEDELWADTMTIAKAKDETATDVIRRALEAYRDENRDLLD